MNPTQSRRDIWRIADGTWGAEVERNGVGVSVRHVNIFRAIWHVLTVRRPDEYATPIDPVAATGFIARRLREHADVHACDDCGLPASYATGSYWLAPDDLWAEVVGTPTTVLCPGCFVERAKSKGIDVSWRATSDD